MTRDYMSVCLFLFVKIRLVAEQTKSGFRVLVQLPEIAKRYLGVLRCAEMC